MGFAGTIAWLVYAVLKLCLKAAVALAIVIVFPWLLLLPVMIIGLLITLVGAVLGGARLI